MAKVRRAGDAAQGALTISDYQTEWKPKLGVVERQEDLWGWIGLATRLRGRQADGLARRERIMLRTLENVERAAELRSRLMKLQLLPQGPRKLPNEGVAK